MAQQDFSSLLSGLKRQYNVHVPNFEPITFEIGGNNIFLLTKDKQKCIEINIDDDSIVLRDYFYDAHNEKYKHRCPKVNNDAFFFFIDFLSSTLKLPVELTDLSTRTLNHCSDLDVLIYLFVKGRTFYERHGFKNEHNFYKRYKDTLFEDMVSNRGQLGTIYTYNTELYEKIDPTWDSVLKAAVRSIQKRNATIKTVSEWFYFLCEMDHPLMRHSQSLRETFEEELTELIKGRRNNEKPHSSKMKGRRNYKKPVSTKYYTYNIDESTTPAALHIHCMYKTSLHLCKPA